MALHKMSFTRYVGEVGVEGTRTVRTNGIILFNTLKLQHTKLLPFVGKEVFCWDADGEIYISTAEYPLYSTIHRTPRPHAGKLIVIIDIHDYSYRIRKTRL